MRGGCDRPGSHELITDNATSQIKYNVMYSTDFYFSEHGTSWMNHSSVESFMYFSDVLGTECSWGFSLFLINEFTNHFKSSWGPPDPCFSVKAFEDQEKQIHSFRPTRIFPKSTIIFSNLTSDLRRVLTVQAVALLTVSIQ